MRLGAVPKNLSSGLVDLWAVNLFTAALPVIMMGHTSTVKYVVADIQFQDGKVHPKMLVLDTSRVRVSGEGEVDLRSRRIGLDVRPRPKAPQYFNLATPVRISGTIRGPHIGVTGAGVIASVFRFLTSVVTATWQHLTPRPPAPDTYLTGFVFQDGALRLSESPEVRPPDPRPPATAPLSH